METPVCAVCASDKNRFLFSKKSKHGVEFNLVECTECGLRFISPRPDLKEMAGYYSLEYFSQRSERGYNNYFSDETRKEIERVFALNLKDLGFFGYEAGLGSARNSLDIGCAAGYFVAYMKSRGWNSYGIDVSEDCVDFAKKNRLNVEHGDYLAKKFRKKFQLITLWASIEHLHTPQLFIDKAFNDLENGGMIYISTCRVSKAGFMNFFGEKWRYYNFPEHLYYFSKSNLSKLLIDRGFEVVGFATYGSGFGRQRSFTRRIADFAAKYFYMGDMMLIGAVKK